MGTLQSFYETRYNKNELRRMRTTSSRTEDIPPYYLVPELDIMILLLKKLDWLNQAIKSDHCPIKRNKVYALKHIIIRYFIGVCKTATQPLWAYKIDHVEAGTPHPLLAIELWVGNKMFPFHIPVDEKLSRLLYNEIKDLEMGERTPNNTIEATREEILRVWDELLALLEDTNWCIYEHYPVVEWIKAMNKWYPQLALELSPSTNLKLTTMMTGGPMIQSRRKDLCKFMELRHYLQLKLMKLGESYNINKFFC